MDNEKASNNEHNFSPTPPDIIISVITFIITMIPLANRTV